MDWSSVSPTERTVSVAPLNAIKVLCMVKPADDVFLGVEVDGENDQVLEFGLGGEPLEDRLLRRAGRAPRGPESTTIDRLIFWAARKRF